MSDELEGARTRKRQTEDRAKMYYDKIRKQEAEVADLQQDLTLNQRKLSDLQRQKQEMDRRMAEVQGSLDGTNRTINLIQKDMDSHKQTIATDHAEMERLNAEVQQLDGRIAGLMRKR